MKLKGRCNVNKRFNCNEQCLQSSCAAATESKVGALVARTRAVIDCKENSQVWETSNSSHLACVGVETKTFRQHLWEGIGLLDIQAARCSAKHCKTRRFLPVRSLGDTLDVAEDARSNVTWLRHMQAKPVRRRSIAWYFGQPATPIQDCTHQTCQARRRTWP